MNWLVPVAVGIASCILTLLAFTLFLRRLRPRLEISKTMAKSRDSKGRMTYKLKVINKSRRSVIKLEAQLHVVTPASTRSGVMLDAKEIHLRRSGLMEISSFDRSDTEANYAYRFTTHDDIDGLWKEDKYTYLKFRIFALDYFSGYGKVFMQEYHSKREDLQEGDFEYGDSFEIKPVEEGAERDERSDTSW